MSKTQAERITALEVQVKMLIDEQRETNRQLGELLALRNKGAGVFWLSSVIFGTSLAVFITYVMSWMKG